MHTWRWCLVALAAVMVIDQKALAHCDTLSGPVVAAARSALKTGEATPVLQWVDPEYETETRKALDRVTAVRARGPEAAALAEQWFLETVVRLHRQGEGESFTGLKDDPVEPALALSDAAIASGSLDQLKKLITNDVASALESRFHDVIETRKRSNESVEAGRRSVEAYVAFIHFVETLRASTADSH